MRRGATARPEGFAKICVISHMALERYAFGDFTLDIAERRLARHGAAVALQPKVYDLLVALVRRSGGLVTKQELLDAVWPGAFVEEGILAVHVSGLRRVLGDDRRASSYIQTVAKNGYRFVAPVTSDASSSFAVASPSREVASPSREVASSSPAVASAPAIGVGRSEVYELVGVARRHLLDASRSALPNAVAAFEQAIDLDPTYAPAHAGLALAFCAQAEHRLAPPAEAHGRARTSALRALAMDPTSADALVALGAVMFLSEWDWIGAERSLQRALEINPAHTQARLLYGHLLEALGRCEDGLSMKLRALEHDPFSPSVHLGLALSYWHQRRYGECIGWANKTLELAPTHLLAREFLAGAYWAMGDFDRHMIENTKHAAAFGVGPDVLEPVKQAYAAGGRAAVARLALRTPQLPPVQLALLHGELGDLDVAVTHLERAIEGRDPCLVDLAVAPQWDGLRPHPRFDRCLAKMGLIRSATPESD
jgi:DNA-binding winged helix-turn-helix (wHTH) protein/tetratricopeptide (TPR) repeat protein